jgi:hypothetical protein
MPKLTDCFLYHNEIELLHVRLQLLSPVVDKFVIAFATETFTGRKKDDSFPWHVPEIAAFRDKIELVCVDKLIGRTAWDKENYSRNLLARAVAGAEPDDLVIISDVDEIPRPDVLAQLRANRLSAPHVLCLDYFNFKFNYQLVHGTQAVWPGPILCSVASFTSPQALRDMRWSLMVDGERRTPEAGWHFSFLTHGADVGEKLASYSHQEAEVQSRRDNIEELIRLRQGFHDHVEPASIWAVVDLASLDCAELSAVLVAHPSLLHPEPADDEASVRQRVKLAMYRLKVDERRKILRWYDLSELQGELLRRLRARLGLM